ncbi:MAG: endonuclease/exonuclease/phosphatase family protein [Pseudomonadota bacterium]|nr:endonuclease/exonuclease/phosphatase family protein [Pseudomonadota bacterium]
MSRREGRPGLRVLRLALILLVCLGVAAGILATLAGFLASWAPTLEWPNHFRPYVLVGAGLLLGLALVLRHRRLVAAAGVFLTVVLALFLLPFAYAAPRADGSDPGLRIVTFNAWVGNKRTEDIARFLESANADIVLLQESEALRRVLLPRLKATYPHAYCSGQNCNQALLAKRPWVDAGSVNQAGRNPLIVWARFEHDGLAYEVIGLHIAWPFHPDRQARHVDWLIEHVRSRTVPVIMAGDFNLTPFSWKLTKLAHMTGLRRSATLLASWPGHRLWPAFLIDHVFSSREFAVRDVRIGPPLGSDHLPVIADVELQTQQSAGTPMRPMQP